MTKHNRDRVSEVLDALKSGLGSFVLNEYKRNKGAGYLREIERTLNSSMYSASHLPDEPAALGKIDVHGWLNLMVRQWNDVFRTRLGKAERSFVGELQEARNAWAHQKAFTNDDVMRVADTATRLLEAVGAAKEAEITRNIKKEAQRLSYEAEMQQTTRLANAPLGKVTTAAREPLPHAADETICEKIMQAVSVLVLQEGKEEFTHAEIRRRIGIERQQWDASYSPTFQGMRADQPGGAPNVGKKFKGVFRQVRHGEHTLTEYGKHLLLTEFNPHGFSPAIGQARTEVSVEATSVLTFDNDEAGYLQWVAANPNGFVINAPKRSGDFPDRLHRASCIHISSPKRTNYTTTDFKKLCSLSKQQLVDWGVRNSSDFRMCQHCQP